MRKPKKVVAYVCEIPIPGTSEMISKADQKTRILKHAQKEGIEVLGFIEDEKYTENFMDRPGVRQLLASCAGVEAVVVERVWCFTRSPRELETLMAELDKKGVPLASTSYLWDCLSQQVRHRYMGPSIASQARSIMQAKSHVRAA